MVLLLLLVLAGIPLLGVVYIALYGSLMTVDGLFMSLILLAMSGILGMNALYELRKGKRGSAKTSSSASSAVAVTGEHGSVRRGKVQDVQFYEAHVGQPNKSVVILTDGGSTSAQTVVLEGDMRNALPVGRNVEIILRQEKGSNVLVDVLYS